MAGVFQSNVFQNDVFQVATGVPGHVFQCDVFQNDVFQGVCGVVPPATVRPAHVPGFWYDEHRKIKEREEREEAGAPVTALSKIPEFIEPPKVWSETDELDELLELMAIMDDHARLVR